MKFNKKVRFNHFDLLFIKIYVHFFAIIIKITANWANTLSNEREKEEAHILLKFHTSV